MNGKIVYLNSMIQNYRCFPCNYFLPSHDQNQNIVMNKIDQQPSIK